MSRDPKARHYTPIERIAFFFFFGFLGFLTALAALMILAIFLPSDGVGVLGLAAIPHQAMTVTTVIFGLMGALWPDVAADKLGSCWDGLADFLRALLNLGGKT